MRRRIVNWGIRSVPARLASKVELATRSARVVAGYGAGGGVSYSILRVTAGSIRVIRNVGKKLAATAMIAMTTGTAIRVSGS